MIIERKSRKNDVRGDALSHNFAYIHYVEHICVMQRIVRVVNYARLRYGKYLRYYITIGFVLLLYHYYIYA